jgi:hypothetical protein
MIPRQYPTQAVEENGTAKVKHVRFLGPVLFWVVMVLAWCALIAAVAFLAVLPKRFEAYMAFWLFLSASFALTMVFPLLLIERRGSWRERQYGWQEWSLMSHFFIIGLGLTWGCTFLGFSREYAFFSFPVVTVTGLIMAFYAAIALLVAVLTRHWRGAVLVLAFVPSVVALIVLRLGLLLLR